VVERTTEEKQSKTLKKLIDGGKTLVFYERGRLRG
jgi:hypothetical protein